jgi:hypothetical protein
MDQPDVQQPSTISASYSKAFAACGASAAAKGSARSRGPRRGSRRDRSSTSPQAHSRRRTQSRERNRSRCREESSQIDDATPDGSRRRPRRLWPGTSALAAGGCVMPIRSAGLVATLFVGKAACDARGEKHRRKNNNEKDEKYKQRMHHEEMYRRGWLKVETVLQNVA